MAGNVWEWTADSYAPYREGEQSAPKGPEEGDGKVVHGGSWFFILPRNPRCAFRVRNEPCYWYDDVGFRSVREVVPVVAG